MKEILKNKLFIIISLVIILVTFITSSCFASDEISFHNTNSNLDITMELFSEITNFDYFIVTPGFDNADYYKNYYVFLCSDNPIYLDIDTSSNSAIRPSILGNSKIYRVEVNKGTTNITINNSTITLKNTFNPSTYSTLSSGNGLYNIIDYANHTIYKNPSSDEVVFQGAPQAQGEAVQVELMKPTQVQEIPQQIVAVVMIVLPIFLGIFGVLLVLYLIKSKNLLQL